MKILMVGDIVGSPGRRAFRRTVRRLREEGEVHVVVANGENAAAGNGITAKLADEIFKAGADVITLGDHCWNQKDLAPAIGGYANLIRPANFVPGTPGKGWVKVNTDAGPLIVVNLLGRVFMPPMDCPFRMIDSLLSSSLPANVPIVVDFHAEATSEKIAMGRYLDGRVAAVVGTHTHVQTSDERVLPGGTAYITDLGQTAPRESVLGRNIEAVLAKFTTGMPQKLHIEKNGPAMLEGALIDVDVRSGKARSIRRIQEIEDDAPD